jgi:undecaprenyl-diphosphatase
MPPAPLEAAALGLVQGATELLPVSSSAHVAALPWLLGWEVARWPPERRKELEVALHAGALLALAPALWRERPDARTLALSLAPPAIAGYALEDAIQRRLSGPAAIAGGLAVGAIALAAADTAPQRRRWGARAIALAAADTAPQGRTLTSGANGAPAQWRRWSPGRHRGTARRPSPGGGVPAADALLLGLAQAAALAPGVSRTGATLAAARARGFAREDASALSFGVAGPVLAGATALKAYRLQRAPVHHARVLAAGAASAFAATALAVRALGTRRRAPLWPYAAERALLAATILAARRQRAPSGPCATVERGER